MDSYSSEDGLEMCKILRLIINFMINLHLKLLTRSAYTLNIVDRLNQACFALYCKLFFKGHAEISKREKIENGKALVRIGAYFLGLGIDQKSPSIY
jgi:hypothetical protein